MSDGKQTLYKVTQITTLFWIIKILATTLGETVGDLLNKSTTEDGLAIGLTSASALTFALIIILVIYSTNKHKEVKVVLAE